MNLVLNRIEAKEVLESVKNRAHHWHRSANTATSEGYPDSVKNKMMKKAKDLYSLADEIERQINRVVSKPPGSSGSVDPFENVNINNKGEALTPNDPVEW